MNKRLDAGQRHLLRLVAKGADSEGWAKVSDVVRPLVEKLPSDLVEIREGEVRLTPIGKVVLIYIV